MVHAPAAMDGELLQAANSPERKQSSFRSQFRLVAVGCSLLVLLGTCLGWGWNSDVHWGGRNRGGVSGGGTEDLAEGRIQWETLHRLAQARQKSKSGQKGETIGNAHLVAVSAELAKILDSQLPVAQAVIDRGQGEPRQEGVPRPSHISVEHKETVSRLLTGKRLNGERSGNSILSWMLGKVPWGSAGLHPQPHGRGNREQALPQAWAVPVNAGTAAETQRAAEVQRAAVSKTGAAAQGEAATVGHEGQLVVTTSGTLSSGQKHQGQLDSSSIGKASSRSASQSAEGRERISKAVLSADEAEAAAKAAAVNSAKHIQHSSIQFHGKDKSHNPSDVFMHGWKPSQDNKIQGHIHIKPVPRQKSWKWGFFGPRIDPGTGVPTAAMQPKPLVKPTHYEKPKYSQQPSEPIAPEPAAAPSSPQEGFVNHDNAEKEEPKKEDETSRLVMSVLSAGGVVGIVGAYVMMDYHVDDIP